MKISIGHGQFWNGDCLAMMRDIPNASVDMILADLPYGTTACKWDTIIPFAPLWSEYWRIAKPNAAIVLTAAQPFTSALIMSQVERFKYEWIWEKSQPSGFTFAKNMPLKSHENICVFSIGNFTNGAKLRMNYNPQDLIKVDRIIKNTKVRPVENSFARPSHFETYSQEFTNYPRSVLEISNEGRGTYIHPTQKPVALFEYLIKTYTQPGAWILDNVAGSGTTAIAAENTGRNWLCIERDQTYFNAAIARVFDHVWMPK